MSDRPQPCSAAPLAPRKARERRIAFRYAVGHRSYIKAVVVIDGASQPARVHDVSVAGIGLCMQVALETGLVIRAELFNAPHLFHCTRLIRIAHSELLQDGTYLVGCEFSTPLAYDQLQALLW